MLTPRLHRVGGADLTDELDSHVYLVDGGDELALVDAGAGRRPEAIVERVRAAGFDPARIGRILLTHAHGDHACGAAALSRLLGGVPVLASPEAAAIVRAGDEQASSVAVARDAGLYPPEVRLEPCAAEGALVGETPVPVGELLLRVIDTPGHCRGHVALLLAADGRLDLLAGDAVFDGGRIALQPIHDCSLADQVRTLRRLRPLCLDGLLAGHGDPVTARAADHVERANAALDRLVLPAPLNPA